MKPSAGSAITLLGIVTWGLAALFFLYEFFLRNFVGTISHQIIPDLGLTAETFALIGTAYYIAYGAMQIPVGVLIDEFGVKWILFASTLICVLSTFSFAYSEGFYTAFISRFFMGFGSSFAFICLLVIALTWFPRKHFGFFAGISQFIGTMGALLAGGPLVVLLKELHGDWRLALNSVAVVGIVLAILILLIVRNKPRGHTQGLVYQSSNKTLLLYLKRLFANKQVWYIALYSATVYHVMILFGAIWGTEYLEVRGLPQNIAADIISWSWFGYAIGCPLLGAFSDFSKRRKPTLIFCSLLGFVLTVSIIYFPTQPARFYGFLFCTLGIAAAGVNVGFATISEKVDDETRATALGFNNGMITVGSILIPPISSWLIDISAAEHGHILAVEDFYWAFSVIPLLYLISFFTATFFIQETFCKPQKQIQ